MYLSDEKELEAVRRVFERKRLFRYQLEAPGECELFEREFSKALGVSHSLILSSGTNALIAALAACGVGPGDEVIIPCYTFVATAIAVVAVGAIPVIANIDETLGLSPSDFENRITDRTKAVIPVHMDGLASDMGRITEIAARRKLFVIEDVAQALGGSYREKRLGTWGNIGCFSLNENKVISCGEGGVLVAEDPALYERAFCMHDGSAQFNPANKDLFKSTRPFLGISMRVSEISGAIMRVQLERLDGLLAGLRERKRIFTGMLDGLSRVRLTAGNSPEGDCGTSLHLRFEDPEGAMRAGSALRGAGLGFVPVTARPAHVSWKWSHLLNAERAAHSPARSPYSAPTSNYSYPSTDYLESVDILSATLKMEIDLRLDLGGTERAAGKIVKTLRAANG